MTIVEAKEYIDFNIKEGVWNEDQFQKMTDEEIIKFAEKQIFLADMLADNNDRY